MKIRKAVEDFVKRGPLPDQGVATEHDVDQRYAMLNMITPPVTDEEAIALAESFGPDECFGLAWTLLHLIETSQITRGLRSPYSSVANGFEWFGRSEGPKLQSDSDSRPGSFRHVAPSDRVAALASAAANARCRKTGQMSTTGIEHATLEHPGLGDLTSMTLYQAPRRRSDP